MRFVPLQKVTDTMVLARPIYTDNGRVLLNRGVRLQNGYVRRLQALGLPGVYVHRDGIETPELPEPISQVTRQAAVQNIRSVFQDVRLGQTFSMKPIHTSVNAILDEIAANPNVLVGLNDVRSYDSYTFGHCINVCVLSVMMGTKFGLHELDLRQLAIGAILHDLGKIAIPEHILKKPGPLDDSEMQEMQNHSNYGWQVLRQHPELSLNSAHVAYQHHERPNGQGYPRGLKADAIMVNARICGIADAYDAMTSERIYKPAMTPKQALGVIENLKGVQFDASLVDVFTQCVAPYPVGCLVQLNQGELAMVVDIHHDHREQPVVQVLFDKVGRPVSNPYNIDLAESDHYFVERIVEES